MSPSRPGAPEPGRRGVRGSGITAACLALAKEPEELPALGQEPLPLPAVHGHSRDLASDVARTEVEPPIKAVNAREDSLGWQVRIAHHDVLAPVRADQRATLLEVAFRRQRVVGL